jgi:hypothetical protein
VSFLSLLNNSAAVYRRATVEHDESGGSDGEYEVVSGLEAVPCSAQYQTGKPIDDFGQRHLGEKFWVGHEGWADIRRGDRLLVTFATGLTSWLAVEGIGDAAGRGHHVELECDEIT